MVESIPAQSHTPPQAPRRLPSSNFDAAPPFSYALASASLEKRAAQSLETYGAKPENARSEPAREGAKGVEAKARSPETETAPRAAGGERPAGEGLRRPASETTHTPPAAANNTPIANPQAQSVQVPIAANSSAPSQTKALEAAALSHEAVRDRSVAAKPPRLAEATPDIKKAFAEILAKRMEGKSLFDIRLDPPELGRIEGRLSIADDGKAVLSLTFDNQGAFDLFSRDEQALRLALHQAGLSFDSGDFNFEFRERSQETLAPQNAVAAGTDAQGGRYDAEFFAAWSAGALDMRI